MELLEQVLANCYVQGNISMLSRLGERIEKVHLYLGNQKLHHKVTAQWITNIYLATLQSIPDSNKMNNSQSQFSGSSSSTTLGQLFDKTVDKMMSDKSFKSSMESCKANSWPLGGCQVR